MANSDIDRAIEVFARGVAFSRSRTYPCLAEHVGRFWVIRDAERKRAGDYRREEWITHGIPAAEVDAFVRKNTRGRFCICEIRGPDEDDMQIRAAYKAAGYRLGNTEPFMAHTLRRIPKMPEPFPLQRVTTQEIANRLAAITKKRPMSSDYFLPDSPVRVYVALDGKEPIGWTQSIKAGKSTWVSDVYVKPQYRRRGIGKSMLVRMLCDDRAHGSKWSVLLASHTGALLYPNVGYEQIGTLMLYTPRKEPGHS